MKRDKARKIVQAVLNDLQGRRGFESFWGCIEDSVRRQLKKELTDVVMSCVDESVDVAVSSGSCFSCNTENPIGGLAVDRLGHTHCEVCLSSFSERFSVSFTERQIALVTNILRKDIDLLREITIEQMS